MYFLRQIIVSYRREKIFSASLQNLFLPVSELFFSFPTMRYKRIVCFQSFTGSFHFNWIKLTSHVGSFVQNYNGKQFCSKIQNFNGGKLLLRIKNAHFNFSLIGLITVFDAIFPFVNKRCHFRDT